ncbi:MAG: HEAT repeat domain-containing protein [Planctomycetota bacterium]|nr:HEAT repeat domain-containing protein [Planctomycetota bacterium]
MALLTAGTRQYRSKLGIAKKIANETDEPRVRRAALLCLAMSNSKTGFKLLNELLDKGGDMAKDAEFALSLMKSKSRDEILRDWMRMPEEMMPLAPFILARYEGEETMSRLRRGKSMKLGMDPVLSVLAYGLVFDVGRPAMLERERKSDDERVRAASLMALAYTGTPEGLRVIEEFEAQQGLEARVHKFAIKYSSPALMHKFIKENTKMGNPRACIGSATALGGLRCKGVEDTLSVFLNHGNPDVRCYAALAMGRVGTREAAERLISRYSVESHPYAKGNIVIAAGMMFKMFPDHEELEELLRDALFTRAHNDVPRVLPLPGVFHAIRRVSTWRGR